MALLKIKILSLLIISSMLFACGGGSSGNNVTDNSVTSDTGVTTDDSATISDSNTPNSENDSELTINDSDMTMKLLIAPSKFLFISKENIEVSISAPELEAQRAYISVYSDYQQLPSGRFYPNDNTRTIAGNLIEGKFEGAFISLNDQPIYLVEVWLYDGQDALQKELTISNNKLTW
jgi:hypothetical protein